MSRKGRGPGKTISRLTEKRISYLHQLAVTVKDTDRLHSARYIDMMERLGRRMDYTLPPSIKRSYCKKCKVPYGGNARVRLKRNILLVTCSHCGNIRRIPY